MKKVLSLVMCFAIAITVFMGNAMPVEAAGYKAQLILESYEVLGNCRIGEESTVKVVFKNVDSEYEISNLLVSCASNNNTVIPIEGKSNQFYIQSISAQGTLTVELPVIIVAAEGGYASMTFNSEYMSDESRWSSVCYIVFPVTADKGSSIVLKNVSVPSEATVKTNILIGMNFLNSTDKDMFNTTLIIEGDVDGGIMSKSLGTVQAKRNSYGEIYVSFPSEGNKNVFLTLRYDDASGETQEEEIGHYSIRVTNPTVEITPTPTSGTGSEDTDSNNENTGSSKSLAIIFLFAAGIILLALGVVVTVNVIKKRREADEEENRP